MKSRSRYRNIRLLFSSGPAAIAGTFLVLACSRSSSTGSSLDFPVDAKRETVVMKSALASTSPSRTTVLVIATATVEPGAGARVLQVQIRRGLDVDGELVGEPVLIPLEPIGAGAEYLVITTTEIRSWPAKVRYCLTVRQLGARGPGRSLQASIAVLVL